MVWLTLPGLLVTVCLISTVCWLSCYRPLPTPLTAALRNTAARAPRGTTAPALPRARTRHAAALCNLSQFYLRRWWVMVNSS